MSTMSYFKPASRVATIIQYFHHADTRRARCKICGSQRKMKMWGPLLKMYYQFQDDDSRALNQAPF